MLRPDTPKIFKKDHKRCVKRGLDMTKIDKVMLQLISEEPLEPELRDHPLIGNWTGRRECHIAPNWLLIYKIQPPYIIFERTGTHTDVFDK